MEKIKELPNNKSQEIFSVESFLKRVLVTFLFIMLIFVLSVFFLIYTPLKNELTQSLLDNFTQLSMVRYNSLQNNIDRSIEGARSLASRTVIRDAIGNWDKGEISLEELANFTQPKYEDGAKALEYLLRAERIVDGQIIANFTSEDFLNFNCLAEDSLKQNDQFSTVLCLEEDTTYFLMVAPVLSGQKVLAHDKLIFDLTTQIHNLCTPCIQSSLVYERDCQGLGNDATILRQEDSSILFLKGDSFYHASPIEEGTYFITKQKSANLLEPLSQLSRQIFFYGIVILLLSLSLLYYFVIHFANKKILSMEDRQRFLRAALSKSNMDPLTKAGTRRFGEKALNDAFDHFVSGENSPALLLFDIDKLKNINDNLGHVAGDRVISAIAAGVHSVIRSDDLLFRWGGDEFVLLVAGLEREQAQAFGEKILDKIRSLSIQHEDFQIKASISIGISYFSEDDKSYEQALNRADQAMYRAKAQENKKICLS